MQRLILGNKDISTSLKMDGEYIDVAWPVYTSSIDIEYLVVSGGGAGSPAVADGIYEGAGGGAGAVNTGSFILQTVDTAPDPYTINVQVGAGGSGQEYTSNFRASRGEWSWVGSTFWQALAAAGAGAGGFTTERTALPSGGDSGIYTQTQISNAPLTGSFASFRFGGYNGFFNQDAGGGAGASQIGGDGQASEGSPNAVGGAGGAGVNMNNWYWNSSLDVVGVIAGGGGGSAGDSASPAAGAGTDGGGNGALGSNDGSDATTFGSGGGGADKGKGGDGADGLVVLRYENRFPINDSGDDVFQVGDYWYHSFYASASFAAQYTFERPEKILIDV